MKGRPPTNLRVSDDTLYTAYLETGSITQAIKHAGLVYGSTTRHRLQQLIAAREGPRPEQPRQFDPVDIPSEDRSLDEIIQAAITKHDRVATARRAKLNALIPIKCQGPFGIVFVPDRHMESPGSHLGLIFDHAKRMAATDGLFINDLGDSIDNFIIGKLERARRDTVVTVTEAWLLVEEYFKIVKDRLIAAISGNHLDWTTMMGGVD